jgi:hypothetical protein
VKGKYVLYQQTEVSYMKMLVLKQLHSEIYLGKNNTLDRRGFNNVSVVFKYSQDDERKKIMRFYFILLIDLFVIMISKQD